MIVHILCMFNKATTEPFIDRLAIVPFRWGWDFNHWVPLMSHCPLHPHMNNHPMINMRPTNPPSLLNRFNTSNNRSMIFYKKPMLSTNNATMDFFLSLHLTIENPKTCSRHKDFNPFRLVVVPLVAILVHGKP
jgi:hypothetical protein